SRLTLSGDIRRILRKDEIYILAWLRENRHPIILSLVIVVSFTVDNIESEHRYIYETFWEEIDRCFENVADVEDEEDDMESDVYQAVTENPILILGPKV